MAKVERPKRRERARNGAPKGALRPSHFPLSYAPKGAPKGAPKSATKGAKSSPPHQTKKLSKKRYFLHYKKGKYYFLDLKLKKGGHQQKYIWFFQEKTTGRRSTRFRKSQRVRPYYTRRSFNVRDRESAEKIKRSHRIHRRKEISPPARSREALTRFLKNHLIKLEN